ncbi:MAG TPA: superoxide dismutase family protein, partial [Gemmatimonadales bacterium]|nr:superoxide dismutase family protein [Gemmatimonadales bacterium]
IALEVAGLAPGPHAVHIHEHGLCERPDFLSAGPHLDEGGHQHGRLNPAGPHLGDLGEITVGPDGRGTAALRFTAPSGRFQPKLIFGGDGTALVVHAGPDDQRTDPSGQSGPRIACGIMI